MKVTFLGTGTSTGVPQIGCHCDTCTSTDPRDKRLRASALVDTDNGQRLLIDCGPDFRQQILRHGSPELTALLITHSHYDHVGGIDDLRPYCYPDSFPVYCKADVDHDLRTRMPYSFAKHLYPGVPTFSMHTIDGDRPFQVGPDTVTPLPVMHAKLPIVGFRIGGLSYITDCKTMPDSTLDLLRGTDTLVINALRHEPHMSHLSLDEALAIVRKVGARQTYLTHISHQLGRHAQVSPTLPQGLHLAYDGLTVQVP